MGCVFGREASSSLPVAVSRDGEKERSSSIAVAVHSGRKSHFPAPAVKIETGVEAASGNQKEEKQVSGRGPPPRGERRRQRPNPRLSNPPKSVQGEQVAAGWPSWLSAVAGEAINGWTPRRADSFEKIDKVGSLWYSLSSCSKLERKKKSNLNAFFGFRLDKELIVMFTRLEIL